MPVTHDFDEAYQAEHRDPLDASNSDFDWQELCQRLGEDADTQAADNEAHMAEMVVRLLHLLLRRTDRHVEPRTIGMRVIALAWVLNPAYFAGSPSLTELAKRCGIAPGTLGSYTGEASRYLQWRNRAQRHAWNWRPSNVPAQVDDRTTDNPNGH